MFPCLYDTDLEYMLAGYRRGWACQRVCFRSGGDESRIKSHVAGVRQVCVELLPTTRPSVMAESQ